MGMFQAAVAFWRSCQVPPKHYIINDDDDDDDEERIIIATIITTDSVLAVSLVIK